MWVGAGQSTRRAAGPVVTPEMVSYLSPVSVIQGQGDRHLGRFLLFALTFPALTLDEKQK